MDTLIIYDHLENIQQEYRQPLKIPFIHSKYAREIIQNLGLEEDDYHQPLERALHACRSLGITEAEHFCHVFCFGNDCVYEDYSMSTFGAYLFLINCDPSHPLVARAQLFH